MKHVRLLYFAAIRELVGQGEETLELPDGVRDVGDLSRHLQRAHPELDGRLRGVRFAVNEAFADAGTLVSEGDAVAVIPPVAGG
jgi:sulfur-carrier protein